MTDAPQLVHDLDRLTDALWSAVATVGGEPSAALCQQLGEQAVALRRGTLEGGRSAFGARIAALAEDQLEAAARAHGLDCHLANVAEQRERMRSLATRSTWRDGVTAAIDALVDAAGYGVAELKALFDRALVMPVITAHPTEARRRSSLDHLTRIAAQLDSAARDPLVAEVLALHATEDARARKPTPLDEVETALDVFRRSLLDVTPRIYRTIEDHIEVRTGEALRLPTFLCWGTWVGGDRDGNPNVTAPMTRAALSRQRAAIVTRYLADVEQLGRTLSLSALRARPGALDELLASIEVDRQRLPEVAAHAKPRTANEPWREKLWYMQARLRATLDQREDGYVDARRYRADLAVLDRSLRAAGFALVAERELRDALRRLDIFGFHLASLDLRQHSGVHDAVVGELLALGGRPGYRELDEAGRRGVLREVLARPLAPIRDREALGAQAREVLGTLDVVGRARRELGPRACERYVVSFTREVSDLLEVAFLARSAGLAPGELRPVPLLEQLEDLERADQIARDTLADPVLATELNGELEVMIGYSDSGKQVGYVASAMALRRAQQQLAAVVPTGTLLTIFHGRGGALGRGGGPASEAIRAQPPEAIHGRLRVTEQGETVTARYSDPEIAERDLELTVGAVLAAASLPADADRD
ncbi:MAG TPA: phosphoenolpyruvate carboxylase, partial [Kofleriaceae bacterium]|nr:phosphoenolpyruvate carboxylase [Kofleriaceae bacterium]